MTEITLLAAASPQVIQINLAYTILGLLVIVLSIGATWGGFRKSIEHLEKDMEDVKTEVNKLKEGFGNIKIELTGVKTEVTGLKTEFSGLRSLIENQPYRKCMPSGSSKSK